MALTTARDALVRPAAAHAPSLRALHHQLLRAIATRPDSGDAMVDREDVAQTTWLRLLERPGAFEGRSTFSTFAIGVALNVQREAWHRAARRRRIGHEQAPSLHDALVSEPQRPDANDRDDGPESVRAALERLDEPERWVILQRLVEERPYEKMLPDFRARFGPRVATVEGLRSLVFRARRRLENLLAHLG